MSKHEKFIMKPITSVIEEMKAATSCIGSGIETYPLYDYVIQSTFTKMTGFQEQKIKCIDWELATNDYDYRLMFVDDVKNKGTYSTYDAKNSVYNALINEIVRYSGKGKKDFLNEMKREKNINPREIIQQILDNTNIIYCRQREYNAFKKCDKEFKEQYFIVPDSNESKSVKLFETVLVKHYKEELYRQRNRIAHNTLSYQQNLPELEMLKGENELTRNYFFWFSILVLIDEIFMELYNVYSKCLKENSYFDD
jgi:hypothetical protein